MEKKDLGWILLLSVILVVTASFIVPLIVRNPQPGQGQEQVSPPQSPAARETQPPPGQDPSRQLKTAISFINLGLIVPLLIIYAGIYRRMRSSFTLGLLAVIFALGMYAVTSNPLIVSLLGGRPGDIGFFQILPDVCATAALLILVRISLE